MRESIWPAQDFPSVEILDLIDWRKYGETIQRRRNCEDPERGRGSGQCSRRHSQTQRLGTKLLSLATEVRWKGDFGDAPVKRLGA